MKTAIIFGANGQDGGYLARLLLSKDAEYDYVIGVVRRASTDNKYRIREALNDYRYEVVEGDITDANFVSNLISGHYPDEIYGTAAQSHVGVSFAAPQYTAQVNYLGCLNILEAIRYYSRTTSFIQCSTSEMFGNNVGENGYQSFDVPFAPCSPYAISKLASYHLVKLYREAYGLHVSNSLGYNHESPYRGEDFVTRKITRYIGRLQAGLTTDKLCLGNINTYRDWSHAKDIVRGMYLALQQDKADDYIFASGVAYSVKEFLEYAFACVNRDWTKHVQYDCEEHTRPVDVKYLRGDASKAKKILGWVPQYSFLQLINEMVEYDIALAEQEKKVLQCCAPDVDVS